jgi:hypothetical protein
MENTMSLSGSIEPGTIDVLFTTLTKSQRAVSLLLHNKDHFAHVEFADGRVVNVTLDHDEGQDVAEALRGWDEGIYTIIKRHDQHQDSGAHAMFVGHLSPAQEELEQWLASRDFKTSLVPYLDQATEIIDFIQPEVVLTTCANERDYRHFRELRQELSNREDPIQLLLLCDQEKCCQRDCDATSAMAVSKAKHALLTRWPAVLRGESPLGSRSSKTTGAVTAATPVGANDTTAARVEVPEPIAVAQSAGGTATPTTQGPRSRRGLALIVLLLLLACGLGFFLLYGSGGETQPALAASHPASPIASPIERSAKLGGGAATPVHRRKATPETPRREGAAAGDSPVGAGESDAAKAGASAAPSGAATGAAKATPAAGKPIKSAKPKTAKHRRRRSRPTKGKLRVSADRPAVVTIDGVERGRTPLTLSLPPKTYTLALRTVGSPSQQTSKTVVVKARKTARISIDFPRAAKPARKAAKPAPPRKTVSPPTDNIDPWAR